MNIKIITTKSSNQDNYLLQKKANKVKFPLSSDDLTLIASMQEKLISLGGVGLAATQLNISKNIAVIYIPEIAAKLRTNAIAYSMHTIINAYYEPITNDLSFDFEGCYSIENFAAKIPRYNQINVTYQNETGEHINTIASGFYARVLQHEIDHLNGLLILDLVSANTIQGTSIEMLKLRRSELSPEKKVLFDEMLATKGIIIDN